jgi:hypothetical protein
MVHTSPLRNLLPYFKSYPLSSKAFCLGGDLEAKEISCWKRLPVAYLSDREKLQLALLAMEFTDGRDGHPEARALLELVEKSTQTALRLKARFLLGVVYFEWGRHCQGAQSERLMRLSTHYFHEAAFLQELYLLAKLHSVLLLVARNRLPEGLKLLHSLSRTPPELALTVFDTLEKVYRHLGQDRWSEFFALKVRHKRYPVRIFPKAPSQALTSPLL